MPSSNKTESSQKLLILAALCLVLSTLDYAIPKPVPFLRIGLANLPILFALELLPISQFFMLVLIKSLGMGVLSGTLLSYIALFSFAGSLASALLMLLLHRLLKSGISLLGLSLAGALASNSTQLLLARFLVFGASVTYMIPLFLAASFLTGTVLGIFALRFSRKSRWLARFLSSNADDEFVIHYEKKPEHEGSELTGRPKIAFVQVLSLACIAIVIVSNSIVVSAVCFAMGFLVISLTSRKNGKKQPSLLVPGLVIAGITIAHLLVPTGKVIFHVLGFPITLSALKTGLNRAFFIEALIFLSKLSIGTALVLPGKTGKRISRLLGLYQEFLATRPVISAGKIISGLDDYLMKICYKPNTLTFHTNTSKMES